MRDVEMAPVIHAKWLPSKYGDKRWRQCSNCETHDYYVTEYKGHFFKAIRNYCPFCGAVMDKR